MDKTFIQIAQLEVSKIIFNDINPEQISKEMNVENLILGFFVGFRVGERKILYLQNRHYLLNQLQFS